MQLLAEAFASALALVAVSCDTRGPGNLCAAGESDIQAAINVRARCVPPAHLHNYSLNRTCVHRWTDADGCNAWQYTLRRALPVCKQTLPSTWVEPFRHFIY